VTATDTPTPVDAVCLIAAYIDDDEAGVNELVRQLGPAVFAVAFGILTECIGRPLLREALDHYRARLAQ